MRCFFIPGLQQKDGAKCAAVALAGLLGGYGRRTDVEELFGACGGSRAGINIDVLQRVANDRGLICDQVLIPSEHLLQPEARNIPSIVLTSSSDGLRCAVLWRQIFGMVQLLDPSIGRQWWRIRSFLAGVYCHLQFVPAQQLSKWLRTPEFQEPLCGRMLKLGIPDSRTLIANAACEPGWQGLACLDALVRQIASERIDRRTVQTAIACTSVVRQWKDSLQSPSNIPNRFWFARVPDNAGREHDQPVEVRGVVALRTQLRPS